EPLIRGRWSCRARGASVAVTIPIRGETGEPEHQQGEQDFVRRSHACYLRRVSVRWGRVGRRAARGPAPGYHASLEVEQEPEADPPRLAVHEAAGRRVGAADVHGAADEGGVVERGTRGVEGVIQEG